MNHALLTALLAAIVLIAALAAMRAVKNSRLRSRFLQSYGKKPEVSYFEGDLGRIRSYFDLLRPQDAFTVDDTTWNDLNLDAVFRRVNGAQTLPGEQILYSMLRTPLFDRPSFEKRLAEIDAMNSRGEFRFRVQRELSRLGRRRNVDVFSAAEPSKKGMGFLLFCLLLDACLIVSVLCAALLSFRYSLFAVLSLVAIALVNSRTDLDFTTFNYIYRSVHVAKTLSGIGKQLGDRNDPAPEEELKRLRWLGRIGAVRMSPALEFISDFLSMIFLLDRIAYEFSKKKLADRFEDLLNVYEYIGKLDATIAVASYRADQKNSCIPELDFSSDPAFLRAEDLVHPLIEHPVPNSLETGSSVLITGSNASGKSTFLKTVAINTLFSQTLCLCLAGSYAAPAFRVMSSMALRDDLSSGESYYIVEIKSIRRIMEAAKELPPVLCIVDEVLRGTNTLERIAASAEVLLGLGRSRGLCVAATHDLELCGLLAGVYESHHFQESIEDGKMVFDYRICPGPSASRNAIRLLNLMGFDPAVAENAERRAQAFLKTGRWEA